MHSLPCIAVLIASSLLTVTGECCLEVFSGAAILTLGLQFHSVPVVAPWDVKFGERWNVLQHG